MAAPGMRTRRGSIRPIPGSIGLNSIQAARDAAYNNNAAVADSAKWIGVRNSASADYRAAHPRFSILPMRLLPSGRRSISTRRPIRARRVSFLFMAATGSAIRARLFACFAEGPAAAGWSVAIPGYTLAPQTNLRGIVAEIGQALDWLVDKGERYGIAGPLVIAGWSAGGQLAAFHLHHPGVIAGLAISGIYDLAPLRDTNLNEALKLSDNEIAEFSQLRLPITRKPLIISLGSAELPTLVHDAWRLYDLRNREGAPGKILPIAGADHFSILRVTSNA